MARNRQTSALESSYTELAYQPMLEVLSYLRDNAFRTYIVTGGGQDFVRVYAQKVYGIPPEQVVGTAGGTKYAYGKDGKPFLTKQPKLLLNDNNAGKPERIHLMTGPRPYAPFGNSTGDREMLEWTAAGSGVRHKMLLLHDDAAREDAYGPAQSLPHTRVDASPMRCLTRRRRIVGRAIGGFLAFQVISVWNCAASCSTRAGIAQHPRVVQQTAPDLCGWIGVSVSPMTAAFADSLGMTEPYGAIFDEPEPGSPAAAARIEQGDVLTTINGSPLMRSTEFANIISSMAPGTLVYFDTSRNGEPMQVTVILGSIHCRKNG